VTDLLIATNNANKIKEIKKLFRSFDDVKVMNYDDLNIKPPIIVEDGKTFRQNSIKKAVTMSKFFKGLVLADDSGLEVDALDGKPGVRSARFARKKATDEENSEKLLKLIEKISENERTARFVCNIAVAKNGHLLDTFEGVITGKIISKPRGKNGFGYDPIFVPNGKEKTFAELTQTLKNTISHRAIALKKLKKSFGKFI